MEEELSENELERRMYAMFHYVDETQANVDKNQNNINFVENVTPTIRRYWHTNDNQSTIYQKVNTSKGPVSDKQILDSNQQKVKDDDLSNSPDLSIFQQPLCKNIKKTIEILENEDVNRVVELESSEEDEVIEVALPPKQTITIESSDDDNTVALSPDKTEIKVTEKQLDNKTNREVTSPVPSVVSSISDEFIRGDCIALNISSKQASNKSFDFSLHGSDLLDQTPTKKKKKKRNKDATSTLIMTPINSTPISVDECFATPKSKAKNKRQKIKCYRVTAKSAPNPDVYDSDSNQSTNEGNKNQSPDLVTNKSLPNTDICESDSSSSKIVKDTPSQDDNDVNINKETHSLNSISAECTITNIPKTLKRNSDTLNKSIIVDLTESDVQNTTIKENIVMGNVSGFKEVDSYNEKSTPTLDFPKCGSTKIPAILNEDLDFDNLKGNSRVCKGRRYSLTTLRAEMDKFYNESWGGEDFNHREIQKNMSRDKSLWVIDPKDRMSSLSRRKITCTYCNRVGHRDETCRMKPPVCYMCGSTGHFEPRCPRKICVNCGSPNHMYSTMCRKCSNWNTIKCMECGQNGHPSSHCPDIWRRYHNTINLNMPLEENRQLKKYYQTFCSGCTRRGHLVHTCRLTLPFSGLPINSPYVAVYRPVYSHILTNDISQNCDPNNHCNKQYKNRNVPKEPVGSTVLTSRSDHLKRQSKSPINHETHLNKKKNFGSPLDTQRTKSPINNSVQTKNPLNNDQPNITNKETTEQKEDGKNVTDLENQDTDKAPDFIQISSENHDKRGQIIQDNEVSDTSDVVTSARIYIPKDIADKLKKDDGEMWMKEAIKKNNIILESDNITFYLSIKGTVGNQEAFQVELRDWISVVKQQKKECVVPESDADVVQESVCDQLILSNDIPKNRNNVMRKLNKAFETLKTDLGDPKALHKELVYLQNRHQQLLKQKVISPQQLSNNRTNINGMLRKLNMVLIGQAGLADGSRHLNELHLIQDKLTNFRQKNISASLREEIGQHFHCIFTAIPRDDYLDLLNKYYREQTPTLKKKHSNKFVNTRPMVNNKNMINTIPYFQRNTDFGKKLSNTNAQNESIVKGRPFIETTKSKLLFYQKRLLCFKPMDVFHKKTKNDLIQKLQWQLTNCQRNKINLKKMKKVQEQVRLFLSNI